MTMDETKKILYAIKIAYPSAFKDVDEAGMVDTVKLWNMILGGEDATVVNAAVIALISTRLEGFTPTIGAVCEKIRELKGESNLSEQEAWTLVSKACRNGYYGFKEEFEKLPPMVQKAVGQAEQLKDWALVDSDTLETVIASNFRKTYRANVDREEQMLRIPEGMRKRLAQITNGDGTAKPLLGTLE